MAEATFQHQGDLYEITAQAGYSIGQVIQLRSGRAAFANTGVTSGDPCEFRQTGIARITKASSIVLLEGGEVYWDHSANAATYKPVSDRDFFVGTCVEDASSTATFVDVYLNEHPEWTIDVSRDAFLTTIVGTQALGGLGLYRRGGAHNLILNATNEAQKVDILSVDGFATGANAIIEAVFTVPSDGGAGAQDISIGVANGTNATDADAITESLFCHLNGGSTTIYLESDDGSTEVAATDTTATYTEGSAVANRVYVWWDMRNPADVQCYVNAVLVLDGTTFNVSAATGPWFLLAHLEKTATTDTYELCLHSLRCRLAEQ